MLKQVVAYHGGFIKIGETAWYASFDKEKPTLLKRGVKTDLGQILLTGRETDILIVAYDELGIAIGMAWGRLVKTFTHVDRAFVLPAARGQKIAERLIAYLLKTRVNILWNAVHDAMDHVAMKFGGKQGIVEGYRGWALTFANAPKDKIDDLLIGVPIFQYCDKCKEKVPTGEYCSNCDQRLEPKIPIKRSIFS
ncbi:MAG: hypothetical protein RBG13Loki_0739 [Promethearchaeota archaeon CR_4]|nr:MAG: hypothetical protein RBG13Loki_0739 [Candidatus Lokiarchaeota archaeon CR_4]